MRCEEIICILLRSIAYRAISSFHCFSAARFNKQSGLSESRPGCQTHSHPFPKVPPASQTNPTNAAHEVMTRSLDADKRPFVACFFGVTERTISVMMISQYRVWGKMLLFTGWNCVKTSNKIFDSNKFCFEVLLDLSGRRCAKIKLTTIAWKSHEARTFWEWESALRRKYVVARLKPEQQWHNKKKKSEYSRFSFYSHVCVVIVVEDPPPPPLADPQAEAMKQATL